MSFERVIGSEVNSIGYGLLLWWKYSRDLALSGFEAQRVIALRLLKLSAGGPGAVAEAHRMLLEKFTASAEAAATLARGGSAPKILKRYRAIMRSNERRLRRQR
ncbi:MAG TPA: hypothetical protein VF835_07015 [Rhizomicrobium sp.]